MASYMIHACPKRMWYVEEFLVPSMIKQGIKDDDIIIFNDEMKLGNLEACIQAFESVPNDDNGIWHLQDDVMISSDFKERAEQYDKGIVYGFTGYYDKDKKGNWLPPGIVKPELMWSSFQCVRIPNYVALDFAYWFRTQMQNNPVYRNMVKDNKYDDWFFKMYCKSELTHMNILNLAPNIAEHVDRLIGGSVINGFREEPEYRSRYWNEPEMYEELRKALNKRNG